MAKVSIVLPCYNSGATIHKAINSVRQQSFKDHEIIVVDDGSSDEKTLHILDALPDDIILIRQDNRGLSAARNAGFRAASGEFVLPLDCDDYLEPDFLTEALRQLEKQPEASFSFAQIKMFGERQGVLKKSYNFFEQLFTNQLPYCLLQHRKTWEAVGGYDEEMRLGYEDWEYNIRLGVNGYYGTAINKPLFNYFVSSHGMLKSISSQHHAKLWLSIQRKFPEVYSPLGLWRVWTKWRKEPMSYSVLVYLLMYISFLILPLSVFNDLFNRLRFLSASERV